MIKTSENIVAFIDILGFSKIIERYDNGEAPSILQELKNAIDPATKFITEGMPFSEESSFSKWLECLDIKLFSDCLCAAAPLEFDSYDFMDQLKFFYKYIMGFQIVMMEKGFFLRGAVTIGSYYSDENMIFSGGLVEAYKLETENALYPRIIVSEKIINLSNEYKESHKSDLDYMLVIDEEGIPYFNHFNYVLIDSKLVDSTVADFFRNSGVDGITVNTFEETESEDKRKSLFRIRKLSEKEVEENESKSIQKKHEWLIDFIDFELNNSNRRQFATFKEWR